MKQFAPSILCFVLILLVPSTAVLQIRTTPQLKEAPSPSPSPVIPIGDYGDAPDLSYIPLEFWDAYPGIPGYEASHFPTCFDSSYGFYPHGVHHLDPATAYLSFNHTAPSAEQDAVDPADPDGVPNLDLLAHTADQDDDFEPGPPDDGVLFKNSEPYQLLVRVYDAAEVYINYLADLNQDGDWNDPDEHIIQDVPVPPDEAFVIELPADAYQGASGPVWVRVTATDEPLSNVLAFPWDGSIPTALSAGETEDYLITILPPYTPTATPTQTPSPAPTSTPQPLDVPAESTAVLIVLLFVISILSAPAVTRPR